MRKFSIMNVALIGLVILLAVLLIDSNRPERRAYAEGAVGTAGGVTGVTGRFDQFGDVLYLIDSNHQTLLIYAFHRPSSGSSRSFERGTLRLLAGRTYKWDTLACENVTIGIQTKPTISDTKRQALKN